MPRPVEFFACEICGEVYDSSEKAVKCEEGGTPAKFVVGDKAAVVTCDLPPTSNPCVVIGVEFEKKTHRPLYTVKSSDGIRHIRDSLS